MNPQFSMSKGEKGSLVVAAVIFFLCHFAFNAENNDSRIVYVKKSEFLRVITGIMDTPRNELKEYSSLTNGSDDNALDDDIGSTHRTQTTSSSIVNTPRSRRVAALTALRNSKRGTKKDSFFFLQRSLESRAASSSSERGNYYHDNTPRTLLYDTRL